MNIIYRAGNSLKGQNTFFMCQATEGSKQVHTFTVTANVLCNKREKWKGNPVAALPDRDMSTWQNPKHDTNPHYPHMLRGFWTQAWEKGPSNIRGCSSLRKMLARLSQWSHSVRFIDRQHSLSGRSRIDYPEKLYTGWNVQQFSPLFGITSSPQWQMWMYSQSTWQTNGHTDHEQYLFLTWMQE